MNKKSFRSANDNTNRKDQKKYGIELFSVLDLEKHLLCF